MFLFEVWLNPGMGRLSLDSGLGDIEFADVFAPVASLAASVASGFMFWNRVEKTVVKYAQATLLISLPRWHVYQHYDKSAPGYPCSSTLACMGMSSKFICTSSQLL